MKDHSSLTIRQGGEQLWAKAVPKECVRGQVLPYHTLTWLCLPGCFSSCL